MEDFFIYDGKVICRSCGKEHEMLDEEYMDFTSDIFGVIVQKRKNINPLIRLYVEDDDNWHFNMEFDACWIPDVIKVLKDTVCRYQNKKGMNGIFKKIKEGIK